MSWSVQFIGTPDKISEALNKHSEGLDGMSKEEFDAALPHLNGLLGQNHSTTYTPVLQLTANGHGWKNGDDSHSNCTVSISPLNGQLV